MCALTEKLYKKGEAKGIEKGIERGFLESISKMVNKFRVSPDEAMDVLKIPENERSFYIEKLKEMN